MEHEQEAIPRSDYQKSLSLVTVEESSPEDARFWSDLNRVYYVPRSIHKLPDAYEWGPNPAH